MNLSNKEELIKSLKKNSLYAKKSMGQNFLVSKNALEKIVESAELKSIDNVLEIGPGLGTLTEELVKKAGKVVAVEKDRKLSELLKIKKRIENSKNLEIINADILDTEPKKIMPKAYKLIANIPYYITGQVFRKFLEADNKPELIVMLVQKEVAERICAGPGEMSVLSVMVQYYGKPEIVKVVKASSFFPAPKVDSAILKIRITNNKLRATKEKTFLRCVKHGFASKRKTLINNLSAGYQLDKKAVADIIVSVGLKENVRAQELSLEDWQNIDKKLN